MRLLGLSPLSLAIGAAALAGLLYLLQRLRVRYELRTVVTTLFWRQALHEARARVLVRRFRHPLAYLLVLLLSCLLWLGFAEPRLDERSDRDHLILIDGSAAMAHGERLPRTLELVRQHLDRLPRDHRRVLWCGAQVLPLLGAGEHDALLEERLRALRPEACPPSIERVLRDVTGERRLDRPLSVVVAGDAPICEVAHRLLPEAVEVRRLALAPELGQAGPAIVALGVREARSGSYQLVDVLCQVRNAGAEPTLRVTLDGQPATLAPARQAPLASDEPDRVTLLFADLPANGALMTVALARTEPLPLAASASLRLPRREPVRVAVSPRATPRLVAALRSDPAVSIVTERPHVAVRFADEPDTGVPDLVLVSPTTQSDAILVQHEAGADPQGVLDQVLSELGLDQIDAMELAQATGQTIRVGAAPGPRRQVAIWEPLLSERYNFVESSAFPLFVAQTLRWLVRFVDDPTSVAAGEPVGHSTEPWLDASATRLDPCGAPFVPPRAGHYRSESGRTLAAALLERPESQARPAELLPAETATAGASAADLGLWIAALALALLVVEWSLVRTGRMP